VSLARALRIVVHLEKKIAATHLRRFVILQTHSFNLSDYKHALFQSKAMSECKNRFKFALNTFVSFGGGGFRYASMLPNFCLHLIKS
jgi:hypothetical protein